MPRVNGAAHYPEMNVLLPLNSTAHISGTAAQKMVEIPLEKERPPPPPPRYTSRATIRVPRTVGKDRGVILRTCGTAEPKGRSLRTRGIGPIDSSDAIRRVLLDISFVIGVSNQTGDAGCPETRPAAAIDSYRLTSARYGRIGAQSTTLITMGIITGCGIRLVIVRLGYCLPTTQPLCLGRARKRG